MVQLAETRFSCLGAMKSGIETNYNPVNLSDNDRPGGFLWEMRPVFFGHDHDAAFTSAQLSHLAQPIIAEHPGCRGIAYVTP